MDFAVYDFCTHCHIVCLPLKINRPINLSGIFVLFIFERVCAVQCSRQGLVKKYDIKSIGTRSNLFCLHARNADHFNVK